MKRTNFLRKQFHRFLDRDRDISRNKKYSIQIHEENKMFINLAKRELNVKSPGNKLKYLWESRWNNVPRN